jgi:hypothetical protein
VKEIANDYRWKQIPDIRTFIIGIPLCGLSFFGTIGGCVMLCHGFSIGRGIVAATGCALIFVGITSCAILISSIFETESEVY